MGLFGEPQEAENEHPPIEKDPYLTPPPEDPSRYGYHSEVQKFEEELLAIKSDLAGRDVVINQRTGKKELSQFPKKNDDGTPMTPFCNAEGQHELYHFADERLKPTTPLSNITVERVFELMKADHIILFRLVYQNFDKWKCDAGRWETIHYNILEPIEHARRRGIDNAERDWVSKITNFIYRLSSGGQPSRGNSGGFGLFGNGTRK